jgi:hypothetical protein
VRIGGLSGTADEIARAVDQAQRHDLQPLVIVTGEISKLQALPAGTEVEVWNEPDIATDRKMTPAQYIAEASAVVDEAQRLNLGRVWIGAVSNLNRRGLDYLHAVFGVPWPEQVGCTVHRYPNGGYDERVNVPHAGFRSRHDEIAEMRSAIGRRPWAVSELGYHTAARSKGWWIFRKSRRWSDREVVINLYGEAEFFAESGAEFLTVYQINDGPDETPINRYGRRRFDGSWKLPTFP